MASPVTLVIPASTSAAVPVNATVIPVNVRTEKLPLGAPSNVSNFRGWSADAAASNAAAAVLALGRGSPGPAPGSLAEKPVMENDGPLSARGDLDVPVSGVSVHELNPTAAQSSGTMRRRIDPSLQRRD